MSVIDVARWYVNVKKKILILKIFTMLIYGSYSVKKDDKKFFGMDLNGIIKGWNDHGWEVDHSKPVWILCSFYIYL